MPAPEGSTLIVTNGLSSATVIVGDISYTTLYQPFDRIEFDNNKLRDARAATGERRIIIEMLGGKPAQILTTCVSDTAVPLVPNSNTVFNNMAQRFDIIRWTVTGAISDADDVNYLYSIAEAHQALLAQFDAHIKQGSSDTSYEILITLQSENFSYLTTTGITAAGSCLESTVSNVLLTNIVVNNSFSIPNALSSNTFYKTYNLTFETREIVDLSA